MTGGLELAMGAWREGLAAAHPRRWLPRLQRGAAGAWTFEGEALLGPGPCHLLCVGKNAGLLASSLADLGDVFVDGLVLGSGPKDHPWHHIEGGHPVANRRSLAAGDAALAFVSSLGSDDRLLIIMSGGGSSMMESPAHGWTLEGIAEARRRDLAAGLDIAEVNRRSAARSRIKDGGLAKVCRAEWAQLTVSDVVDGPAGLVASGPFLGLAGEGIVAVDHRTMASAAANWLRRRGLEVGLGVLGGEAVRLGRSLAPPAGGALVLSGEASVAGPFRGSGGRNAELVAGWLCRGDAGPWAVVAGASDGLDGSSGCAGVFATQEELGRLDGLREAMAVHDLAPWFEQRGRALVAAEATGHVGDLVVLVTASKV